LRVSDSKFDIRFLDKANFGLFGSNINFLKGYIIKPMNIGLEEMGFINYHGVYKAFVSKFSNGPEINSDTFEKCKYFVMFREPPSFFEKPYKVPKDYSNVISFQNGYTLQLLSYENTQLIRGLEFDGLDIYINTYLDDEVLNSKIYPIVRGNVYHFSDNSSHQQICFYINKL
jgi:hypothetical protein